MKYSRKFAVVTGADASDLHSILDGIIRLFEETEYELKHSHFVHRESDGKYDLLFLFEKENQDA